MGEFFEVLTELERLAALRPLNSDIVRPIWPNLRMHFQAWIRPFRIRTAQHGRKRKISFMLNWSGLAVLRACVP